MSVIKCKMCGGDLILVEGMTVAECEYCGTMQTVPSADSDKKLTLFGRAGRLLRACEFDKAAGVYETIVTEFPEEAEAYWGLVLCKYGIEYVDDPATGKKIPTCHRSSFESVLEDSDFEQAAENADSVARRVYREEAKMIERLRNDIIETSAKEAPYDIFICYKETDESGERTIDSVMAQDVYRELTEMGYRVFFARISLEDKLGQQYEPYIFSALNSAKIMLAFGTDYEYFNAVWVKNEWSRFLKLIEAGQKKTLIPCYKGIDAYDMPKEFARLQAQDMGKVGAMQDLLRGIEKILPREKAPTVRPLGGEPVYIQSEREKRIANRSMIRTMKVIGTNDPKEFFPKRDATTSIDRDQYSRASMQIVLRSPLGYTGNATYGYTIYDHLNNVILNGSKEIAVKPNVDRLAFQWIVCGDDGTKVAVGDYRIEAWINDSSVFEYRFQVTSSQGGPGRIVQNALPKPEVDKENIYLQYSESLSRALTEEHCLRTRTGFQNLGDYKDSAKMVQVCDQALLFFKKDREIREALASGCSETVLNEKLRELKALNFEPKKEILLVVLKHRKKFSGWADGVRYRVSIEGEYEWELITGRQDDSKVFRLPCGSYDMQLRVIDEKGNELTKRTECMVNMMPDVINEIWIDGGGLFKAPSFTVIKR